MPKVKIDDTLEMYYEDDNFADSWKPTETLVFHHCNAGSSRMYYRWAPVVARHYRFIRLDRRGQGQSTVPPPGHPWSMKEWAQETDVFLDRLGLEKVHLIGEATGSYVVAHYAYEHPERVSSLTLINCSPSYGGLLRMAEFARLLDEGGVEGWVRNSMAGRFDPNQVDPEYIEWHAQEKPRQPQHVSGEVLKLMGALSVVDILPQIKAPTLVIVAGEGEQVHTQEAGQQLKEMIPDCKVATIPGVAGYVAHAAPEKCAEAWLEFVRGLG